MWRPTTMKEAHVSWKVSFRNSQTFDCCAYHLFLPFLHTEKKLPLQQPCGLTCTFFGLKTKRYVKVALRFCWILEPWGVVASQGNTKIYIRWIPNVSIPNRKLKLEFWEMQPATMQFTKALALLGGVQRNGTMWHESDAVLSLCLFVLSKRIGDCIEGLCVSPFH